MNFFSRCNISRTFGFYNTPVSYTHLVGGSNITSQIAEKSFDATFFHLVCSGTEMDGRYLLDALPLKGAQVNTPF